MKSLQEAIGRELRWRPRSTFARTYDLVDPQAEGGEPYATLAWRPRLLTCGPAEACSGDGSWTFLHRGFFRGTIQVVAEGAGAPIATAREHVWRAALRLADGREFLWRRESLWGRSWRFEDANGSPVVRIRRPIWPVSGEGRVEMEASAAGPGDRALLACLGWYMTLLARTRHSIQAGS